MPTRWIARQPEPAVETLAQLQATGLTSDVAALLVRRGVATTAEATAFLTPGVAGLHDPLLLKGMREAR